MLRDEMRPFGHLTPFPAAMETALALAVPVDERERVSLRQASSRVLAEAIVSPVDLPASPRAAMDGYAVRAEDIAGCSSAAPAELRCRGCLLAGMQPPSAVDRGNCIEIATGAPLPPGTDTVVPVEETELRGDRVWVKLAAAPGTHVSERGEDLREGETLAPAGALLSPAIVAALAAVGIDTVQAWRRPKVLLVPTGNEVVPQGESLPPGHVYDSNSIALQALLEANGADAERADIVTDDGAALAAAIGRPGFDMVVTIGGTSVGRHDLVIDVVGRSGEVLVHGVAMKPGKPLMLARLAGRPVVGLPGFPTSCLLLGYGVLEPMVRRLARLPQGSRSNRLVKLAEPVSSPAGKHQLLTVILRDDGAIPAYRASSTISSMSAADGWIVIDAATERLSAGTDVQVMLF
ncbi:MAG: gephyrin-like molybdotransferase Glp [Acidobacteriota bacterium]